MSRTYSTKDKNQKHPKVHYTQYLYNVGEPQDNISQDTSAELEAELVENSFFMRHRIRHTARLMRNYFG